MRKGFGIISALIILVLVATLMMVVTKVAFMSTKHTIDSYLIERARLFQRSVIENSLMAIEGYKRSAENKCLEHIYFTDENKMFDANVTVLRYYCYKDENCPCGDLTKVIQTDKSNGYVLLKVTVESNLSNPKIKKLIRLQTTTLQRP